MNKHKLNDFIITSEQVGKGHPDKIADQISDHIFNAALKQDEDTRSAIETVIGKYKVFITGELTTKAKIDIKNITRKVLLKIDSDYKDFEIETNISKQSLEISKKVDKENISAGDQGLMYGYATNETINFLPIPFSLATEIIKKYEKDFASVNKDYKFDSKSQVSYNYTTKKIININMSVQHSKNKSLLEIKKEITNLIKEVVKNFERENKLKNIIDDETQIIVNNSGTFILGGALADSGLTGRKIIADTYGGWGRHGGGAFSGKDYTKVDRSASYYARYVATQIVNKKLCEIIEIQVSYIIGEANPIAINFETFETEKVSLKEINDYINTFNFTLKNIINELNLRSLDYTKTTVHGHFGKNILPWK